MRYTLLVLTPPDAGSSPYHALAFARALVDAGHELACVFFFNEGVLTALSNTEGAQDENDLRAGWSSLAESNDIELHACVASAARFGVSQRGETDRLQAGFVVSGLGELVEATGTSDRVMTFAG